MGYVWIVTQRQHRRKRALENCTHFYQKQWLNNCLEVIGVTPLLNASLLLVLSSFTIRGFPAPFAISTS